MKEQHLAKNHVTPYRFAALKSVTRRVVLQHITSGYIKTDLVGWDKAQMIDLKKYKDYQFKFNSRRDDDIVNEIKLN